MRSLAVRTRCGFAAEVEPRRRAEAWYRRAVAASSVESFCFGCGDLETWARVAGAARIPRE